MKLRRHYNSPAPALARQKSFRLGVDGNGRRNSGGISKSSAGAEHKLNQGKHQEVGAKVPKSDDQNQRGNSSSALVEAQSNTGVMDITDQFDYTFWAGDLNYRVDLTREEAEECLQRGDLEVMISLFSLFVH